MSPYSSPDEPLATFTLLRLLDEPEAPDLAEARARLEASPASQERLDRLLRLEARLLEATWARAVERAADEPVERLPAELEARLMAITSTAPEAAGAASATLERADRAPGTAISAPSSGWRRPWSSAPRWLARGGPLAALLLVAGAALVMTRAPLPIDEEGPGTVRDRSGGEAGSQTGYRGSGPPGDGVDEVGAPLALWVQMPGEAQAHVPVIEPVGQGRWRIEVDMEAVVQLRIARPAGLAPDDVWQARAALFRRTAAGERIRLEVPPLEATGDAAVMDEPLGRPIRLSALAELGFRPGEVLEYEIQHGQDTWRLDVVLSASLR